MSEFKSVSLTVQPRDPTPFQYDAKNIYIFIFLLVKYNKTHCLKDYKLRGLDTRQRRPQKWRYKPNYSILTQVFLDLPQLLQSSTDRAECRQTKHINQCSRHTFQSVFIDYPRQPHIHTGSDFSQLWIICFVLKPRLRKS